MKARRVCCGLCKLIHIIVTQPADLSKELLPTADNPVIFPCVPSGCDCYITGSSLYSIVLPDYAMLILTDIFYVIVKIFRIGLWVYGV